MQQELNSAPCFMSPEYQGTCSTVAKINVLLKHAGQKSRASSIWAARAPTSLAVPACPRAPPTCSQPRTPGQPPRSISPCPSDTTAGPVSRCSREICVLGPCPSLAHSQGGARCPGLLQCPQCPAPGRVVGQDPAARPCPDGRTGSPCCHWPSWHPDMQPEKLEVQERKGRKLNAPK